MGYRPLDELERHGEQVIRVDASLEIMFHPSVEIRRDPSGAVRLRLFSFGHVREGPLTPGQWYALVGGLSRALEPRDKAKEAKAFADNHPQDCHNWQTIEASTDRLRGSRFSVGCFYFADGASIEYFRMIKRMALDAIPDCRGLPKGDLGFIYCVRSLGKPTVEYERLNP